MDKYEFNLKIEQIKKLAGEGDYATALRVTEAIDWNRVRNVNLLTLAANVFEENQRFDDAKDTLILAMERSPEHSPAEKRILYKLTELAVRSGNVTEAEDYYQEYSQAAPDDPGCLLLQYMIMKVKHAPYPQLIQCLELYCQYDPDEKWMYELATTYESAGRIQDAVALADRISLMFADSPYGLKALRLKQKYAKLTEEQRALLYPNSIANAGVHYAKPEIPEEKLTEGDRLARIRIENEDEYFHSYLNANDPDYLGRDFAEEETEEPPMPAEEEIPETEEPDTAAEEEPAESAPLPVRAIEPEPAPAMQTAWEETVVNPEITAPAAPAEEPFVPEETPVNAGFITDPEIPAEPAGEKEEILDATAKIPVPVTAVPVAAVPVPGIVIPEKDPDAETILADARVASAKLAPEEDATIVIRPKLQARPTFTEKKPEKAEIPAPAAPVKEPAAGTNAPAPKKRYPAFHLIIEAEDDQEGLDIAVEELKLLHAARGLSNGAVKTAAEKLNEKGLTEKALQKIAGKDFVIEHAGEMQPAVAESVYRILSDRRSDVNVVLVDNADGLDKLEETLPGIFDLCEYLTDEDARNKDYSVPAPAAEDKAPVSAPAAKSEKIPAGKKTPAATEPEPDDEPRVPAPLSREYADGEVMSIDDFAQYCVQYATDIDCVIDGKSMLALYERIELLEEDGVALTKQAAEDLIEDTADRAEKPPIGKRISGLFHSKYNKDGLLILKEEDFIY